jgi:hypothetical protein
MVSAGLIVSAQGATELRELAAKVKAAGRGDLRKKLRKNIRDAGKPVIADLRGAAMGVRMTSTRGGTARPDRSSGLRARTARAVGLSQTRNGIRIRVSAARFGPYGTSMPRYLDASLPKCRTFRHPVFGNREVWTEQSGSPWFFVTINKHRARFRRAVFEAMDELAKELAR